MSKVLNLSPFFSERLWGCQKLLDFGFEIPRDKKIGEAWVISALPNGMSYVTDGPYKGMSLKEVYETQNDKVFKDQGTVFPLLSKIITANDFLSVQVHPDDEYALKNEHSLGKPECWYVLDAPADGRLIYGHNARNKIELTAMVENHEWSKLFKTIKVQAGDFVYVPPGKVHALGPGVTVFELQRSSDITYRFYDFDRKDKNNQLRPLHIKQCLDTTTVPDSDLPVIKHSNGVLIDNEYFTLQLINCSDKLTLNLTNIEWVQITVIDGNGTINGQASVKGMSFIMYDFNFILNVSGKLKFLLSYKR